MITLSGFFYGGDINSYVGTTNIVAGVVWTLKYEWFFYLSLPFTSFLLYRFKGLGAGLIITLAIIGYIYPITIIPSISSKYFLLFVIGDCIAYLNKRNLFKIINFKQVISQASLCLVC
jgi:peptidoglycan/LPS O-acetylase OafA/YrhL